MNLYFGFPKYFTIVILVLIISIPVTILSVFYGPRPAMAQNTLLPKFTIIDITTQTSSGNVSSHIVNGGGEISDSATKILQHATNTTSAVGTMTGGNATLGSSSDAQYNASYCQGKKSEMFSRAQGWLKEWGTAANDPNGLLRSDGKQLTSEIGITLGYCDSLSDHDKLILTQMMNIINAEIDRNINYGPPCTPLCKSGPPIT